MNGLTITIPPPLVRRLREKQVASKTINATIVDALWKLVEQPSLTAPAPGETTNEYFRRIILDMRSGVPPSPDEPFVKGMTRAEYFALSEDARKALWDKWEEAEWEKIEKQYPRGVNVKPNAHLTGQKRSTQNPRRIGETRGRYRARRK